MAWDACTMEPNQWLRWIECHPGLAGYVQAVGVVGTLMLALLGPPLARWIERARERIARGRDAVSLAHALLPSVNVLLEETTGRLETLGTYSQPEGNDMNLFVQNMTVVIPGALDLRFQFGNVDDVRLGFFAHLVDAVRAYNNGMFKKQADGVRAGEWDVLREQIRADLTHLRELVLDASARIRDM